MNLKELILKNRSYRRFFQNHTIEKEDLVELVNLARLSPSGANNQPLKYMLSYTSEMNNDIFQHLFWAGYLKDWNGPEEGERPSGYIVMLCDKNISQNSGCDHGIAAQSILLGATELGLGGCILGSIKREELKKSLNISDHFDIQLVIALGKPKEKVVIDSINDTVDIKYWRDGDIHHVPKRSLEEIIVTEK